MAGEGLKQSRDIFPDDAPKKNQEFNKAMNPPNNPTKDRPPTSYNPSDDYPSYGDKGNPITKPH